MKAGTRLRTFFTFAAAVTVGCAASIAIASVAAVSQAAPSLRHAPEIVRPDPVAVTISQSAFDAIHDESSSMRAVAGAHAQPTDG